MIFRVFQHLLPDAKAWRLTIDKTLRRFFVGLAPPFEDVKDFADDIYSDLSPETTRELVAWEAQYGLTPALDAGDLERRQALAAAWRATGGQSPAYLQGVVQAAGFDLYIHEWWEPGGPPYVARDPRDYTQVPTIGTFQCYNGSGAPECLGYTVGGLPLHNQPQCTNWLANEPGYLVNQNLTLRAPPVVPDDPAKWPYFLYWGGETFGTRVEIPASRRAELERLLLKLCPTQQWLVLLVDYANDVFDDYFDDTFS